MGEYEKSLHYFNLSISLNPLNWESRISAGRLLIALGRYDDAEEYIKKTIDLAPTFYMLHGFLFKLYLRNGQIKKAREFLQNNPKITHYVRYNRARMEFIDGNYDKALKIIKSTSEEEFFRIKFRLFHLLMRNLPINELATKHFESGKVFYLNEIEEIHDDPMLYCSLSLAYAGLGMKSEALEAGEKALDILNYSDDAFWGFENETNMVRIYLMVGEYEEAIRGLENMISWEDGRLTVERLKFDPFWDPIRELDGFKAIINNPEYQVNINL